MTFGLITFLRDLSLSIVAFSAIWFCPLSTKGADAVPTSLEFHEQAMKDSQGVQWQPLFNGRNLDGWKVVLQNAKPGEDPESIFQVVDGVVHVYKETPAGKKMPFGVILSDKEYSSYRFQFEYKWGTKKFAPRVDNVRDAGLLFHVIGPEKIWPTSVEFQVQEGDVGDNYLVYTVGEAFLKDDQKAHQFDAESSNLTSVGQAGKITRVIKSKTLEHDGWNSAEVIVRGDSAVYLVNGEVNNYVVGMKALVGPDKKLAPLTSGKLALQCEGAEISYRNIQLLPLPEKDQTPGKLPFTPVDESIAPIAALSPEQSLQAWKPRDGYRVELVAAEPLLMDPVAIDWGLDGKLWVVEMADYPLGIEGQEEPGGRIRYLEDTNNDGTYDASTLFLEGVNFPTGIVSWGKGVIVTAAPEIFYAEDTDGDGQCDVRRVLFSGFQEGNQQLRINGLRWGLDGWLHCASGSHNARYGAGSRVRSHVTGKEIVLGSRDFRFNPATGEIDPLSGPSQYGRNKDDFGNWFGVQNSYPLWHYVLEDRYLRRNPHVAAPETRQLLCSANPRVFPVAEVGAGPTFQAHVGRFTSACSGMIYRDQLLPVDHQMTSAFSCEPVHNLVQRNLLTRHGATFTMQRDADGETPDFLASADPWTRPVMVRTGPDGALWVVDMYRYHIEHPHWVSGAAKKEMMPFVRLGDGRGRLYRVLPEGVSAREVPDILQSSPEELAALLEHPNGWVRDAAQRRLIELADDSTISAMKNLLRKSSSVPAKLHAAYVLQTLGAFDSTQAMLMFEDPSEEVRRTGLILAEGIDEPSEELLTRIVQLVDDSSAIVRLQLACSLGEWNDPAVHAALAQLWQSADPRDAFLQAALLSSVNADNIAANIAAVTTADLATPTARQQFRQLMQQALAFEEFDTVRILLNAEVTPAKELVRAVMLLDLIQQSSPKSPARSLLDAARITQLCSAAKSTLQQDDQPNWIRAACVLALFRDSQSLDEDRKLASDLLGQSQLPTAVTSALIDHLGRQSDPLVAELLLTGWPGYLPAVRNQVLEVWAAHPGWYPLLVQALDRKEIGSGEISLALQQQFLTNAKSEVKKELQAKFKSEAATSKSLQAVAQDVLNRTGDAMRGRAVFQKNCIDCHQFRGEGQLVGANLASVTSRTSENMIEAILSPNKAVEPKYLNYAVVLTDGRIVSGLIESDAGTSLTLLKAKGERTPILRTEIEELRSTGKSLMPEGFEKTIPPQDLADLLKYLQLSDRASVK